MQYTEELIKEIASKSLINSSSLISDAELLFENKRYQRAYTLYQLGMEEAGKAVAAVLLLIEGVNAQNMKLFHDTVMCKHQIKIKKSSFMDIYVAEHFFKKDWDGALKFLKDSVEENVDDLNKMKNTSIYTSVVNNGVFIPKDIIGIEQTKAIQFKAITRYSFANAWVTIGLKHLEEIKQYILKNPLDQINVGEAFWKAIDED